jgi:hypothetical protein
MRLPRETLEILTREIAAASPDFARMDCQYRNHLIAATSGLDDEDVIQDRFFGAGFMQERGSPPLEIHQRTILFLNLYGNTKRLEPALGLYLETVKGYLGKNIPQTLTAQIDSAISELNRE